MPGSEDTPIPPSVTKIHPPHMLIKTPLHLCEGPHVSLSCELQSCEPTSAWMVDPGERLVA